MKINLEKERNQIIGSNGKGENAITKRKTGKKIRISRSKAKIELKSTIIAIADKTRTR